MYVPFLLLAIAFQSSESLYEAPKDLSKVNSKVFELLTEKSGFEVRLAEWRRKIDTRSTAKMKPSFGLRFTSSVLCA